MASADYRTCDMCGGKAFYDANLSYDFPDEGEEATRQVGKICGNHKLDYVGDWAVLCTDCSKTHRCVIEPIDGTEQ